jgi:hypothetical protein
MTQIAFEVDPAHWVDIPDDPHEASWVQAAAAELLSARSDTRDPTFLEAVLDGLGRLPRDHEVIARLALFGDIERRYWLLDVRVAGQGTTPDAQAVREADPTMPGKHVEDQLVGGKFRGTRRYEPAFIIDPEWSGLRSEESRSELLVPTFVYMFSLPGADANAEDVVVEATLSHFVVEEAVMAFPAVEEVLGSLQVRR